MQRLVRENQRSAAALVEAMREQLAHHGVREDYAAVVDARTLEPLSAVEAGRPARALVAGFVGTTRLIDNAPLDG